MSLLQLLYDCLNSDSGLTQEAAMKCILSLVEDHCRLLNQAPEFDLIARVKLHSEKGKEKNLKKEKKNSENDFHH